MSDSNVNEKRRESSKQSDRASENQAQQKQLEPGAIGSDPNAASIFMPKSKSAQVSRSSESTAQSEQTAGKATAPDKTAIAADSDHPKENIPGRMDSQSEKGQVNQATKYEHSQDGSGASKDTYSVGSHKIYEAKTDSSGNVTVTRSTGDGQVYATATYNKKTGEESVTYKDKDHPDKQYRVNKSSDGKMSYEEAGADGKFHPVTDVKEQERITQEANKLLRAPDCASPGVKMPPSYNESQRRAPMPEFRSPASHGLDKSKDDSSPSQKSSPEHL